MINLETPLSSLSRIQKNYLPKLKKLGIITVRDLLFHFPFRYDDYSAVSPISEITPGKNVTVEGTILKSQTTRTWKRKMFVTEIILGNKTEKIKAVWFNQPYLADQLTEGKNIRISGKIRGSTSLGRERSNLLGDLYFSNPAWEFSARTPTNTGRLVPVYPETEGVSSRWLRWQIQDLLKLSPFSLNDPLSPLVLKKLNLPPIEKALHYIHFPSTLNHALIAQKRFAFEEMFLVQIKSLQIRSAWQKEQAVKIKFDEKLVKDFVSKLPFKLTNAQRKSSFEILKDLEKNRPMNRLLNGDVGSGKTVVAAAATLQAISAGYQVTIMAPTEVLARQHFESFSKMFSNFDFNIALLTNSYRIEVKPRLISRGFTSIKRAELLKKISGGEINLIIGTHALIQEDIRFKNLALIIIDEQHRFGVAQRAYLQQKSSEINDGLPEKIPHFLTMTATPIPRTLSLAFFGNLDISLLDEMPAERKKIITKIIEPLERNTIYNFIRTEIKKGRQCFVILPLVEESKVLTEVKAATAEYKRLSENVFPDLKIGLVHGRLKSDEKEKVMASFVDRNIDILVATAVVEVGIDIPNATVMIIEDADRFGLSQLHQFRGRIGRGAHQSYCFLFTGSTSANAKKRLKALVEHTDGFKIAQIDLELRGPGEFFGARQSGLPDIAMENIANVKLIQVARAQAEEILKEDPQLKKHPLLKDALQKFQEKIHLE